MSRTLTSIPFITAILTLTAVITICVLNMYVLSKLKRSWITIYMHFVSLLVICGLIFHMMGAAVFVLPLSGGYKRISRGLLLMAGSAAAAGAVALAIWGRRHHHRGVSIPLALSGIEDIVFVTDREGQITYINHPNEFHNLFGKLNSISQLLSLTQNNDSSFENRKMTLDNVADTQIFETIYEMSSKSCRVFIAPIVLRGNRLGYTAVIEDISVIMESERLLQEQNKDLSQANKKLTQSIRQAGALEAEKERLQILVQVQTTLVRDIEKALSTIRRIKQQDIEEGTYPASVRKLAIQFRQIYHEVRGAVGSIAGKEA